MENFECPTFGERKISLICYMIGNFFINETILVFLIKL